MVRAAGSRTSWAAGLAAALLLGCGRDKGAPSAAAPRVAAADAAVDTVPELEPSFVSVPVRYELAPAVTALERAVPRTVGNLDQRRPVPDHARLQYAFVADRAPFEVAVRGSTVTVSSIVTYRARGWLKPPIGPSIGGSCGTGDDPPPRLRITLVSSLKLASDWKLRADTRVPAVAPASGEARDRCKMTVLNLDLTDKVVGAVQKILEGKADLIDARVSRLDIRSRVDKWWGLLGRPIRVTNDVWLQLRPEAVQVGALRADDDAVIAPVALTARPRLVTGPRPDSAVPPLPDFTPGMPSAGGLHLLLEAALDYESATRMIARQLVGRSFTRAGQTVVVRDARAFAARGGRVALALRLGGDVDARVVLAGRPVYDHATGTLRIPDLDYAVADASLLVRGADQVGHDALRDALRERAQFPVAALVDSARARAERAMNRELTKGVRLGAKVETGRALGVFAANDGLRVRAAAGGQLSLDIDRPVRVKAKRPAAPQPPKRPGVR